ncbi:NAD-dependent epimerase/dehydratase family protein [Actinomadura logoneensis]|uniref:NAD-dependent epimerase/dehydratase family protein n=1 Tax=Actinomadura logoneensis TaxID=2293572 RepID=A0A372JSZ4_9ACTN|nr:NAD(P)H-binding protein [Actinomadura logoneensis]RFU43141.1 NAD-dependent epimerase/dehydratase family protein [Actinomadura logoneensis]
MTEITVFGAGGRVGRAVVREALARGHRVTAVVRDPSAHTSVADEATGDQARAQAVDNSVATTYVRGDITDADAVARLTQGRDAVVNAAADLAADPGEHFPAANRALLASKAPRVVAVGLGAYLAAEDGPIWMDLPAFPSEFRPFCEGHLAGVDVLRKGGDDLDWLVLSPSGDFDHEAARTGEYREAPGSPTSRISVADFAIAVLDQIDAPSHTHKHVGVEGPTRP